MTNREKQINKAVAAAKEISNILHDSKYNIDNDYSSNFIPVEDVKLIKYVDLNITCKKQTKLLEILKNKNVNICLIKDCYNLQDYNDTCIYLRSYSNQISKSIPITKEEYNLLKEWLDERN